ncbi:amidase signature domain-containing protein, partial [Crucibulum laeve]
ASEIVQRIEKGEWTASEVLEAFIARSVFAHEKTNCLTEVMFDWGRQQAKELDEEFKATGKIRGPLHGVPVSIKDQFDIVGVDSCIGFSQWANKPATTNADVRILSISSYSVFQLVKQLLAAGALIYVKTNVPQTMLAFECSNPVWGRTTNPWNDKYTCGGSSGGEGALLAMDGSALGIGSDIGGSLRIPAAYCGIYSFKPGSGRISYAGARGPTPGFEGIRTAAGPMGRSVQDLKLLARVSFGVQGANHDIAPLPYRQLKLASKLRFGYYTSDDYIKASPACKRAVLETVEALRREGHECVEIKLPNANIPFNIFGGLVSADGYKKMLSHLGPDPKENALFLITLGPKLNWAIRSAAAWLIERIWGDKLFADTIRVSRVKPVHEYAELVAQRNEYAKSFYQLMWDELKLDGIIAPVQAVPQLPHGGCDNFAVMAASTVIYNTLDLPAGCLPVTRVDPLKDQLTDEWTTGPGLGSPIIEAGLYRGKNPIYDPVAARGMPVNIQIVGKKWEEEKVLAMMTVIDQALGERDFGPGAWDKYMEKKQK